MDKYSNYGRVACKPIVGMGRFPRTVSVIPEALQTSRSLPNYKCLAWFVQACKHLQPIRSKVSFLEQIKGNLLSCIENSGALANMWRTMFGPQNQNKLLLRFAICSKYQVCGPSIMIEGSFVYSGFFSDGCILPSALFFSRFWWRPETVPMKWKFLLFPKV